MQARLGGIKRAKLAEKMLGTNSGAGVLSEQEEELTTDWCTLYRRNWDVYAEFHLGIPLKPYQRDALHEIGISDTFFWRAGRGGAKSFVTAIAALCKLFLYPNCWVVVTASTVDQANAIVEDKMERELIKKISPYLLYFFEKGWLEIKKPGDGYIVTNNLNNSVLKVLAPVESSRRSRSNFTIYDEAAVMKKSAIDQIFEGMLYPRQPNYLSDPKYSKNPRWVEESKSIYLTSSKFKYQWWYRTWKDCVTGYYMDNKSKYNVFATDFFDNIDNGLKTWGDYRRYKRTMNEFDYRMEMLNEAIGESEDAFFTIKSFKDNQVLSRSFKPPTSIDIYMGNDLGNPPKRDNEVRLVVVDFAFSNTTTREKNDNTIIYCISGHWKKNRFERHVDYIEGWPASDSIGASDRARELYWDYDADYLAPDLRNGGEVLYNHFTEPLEHSERGSNWNPHGLTVSTRTEYQVVPETKLADLRQRTVDPKAVPCLIPVTGTSELNSIMWVELKKNLECGNVKFLMSMGDKQTELEDNGEYFNLSSEQLAEIVAPYGQTDLMIQEAINLKAEFKSDRVKLVEPRSGTKDRVVVLSYGNYLISLIENSWNKQQQQTDFNIDDIQCVW